MARPVHVFLLVAATLFVAFGGEVLYAQTSSSQGTANDVRAACAQELQKLCANVPPGGGRIFACLKQHQDQVSDGCKQSVAKSMGQANGGAGSHSPTISNSSRQNVQSAVCVSGWNRVANSPVKVTKGRTQR